MGCSTQRHEEEKLSPSALAKFYDRHDKPWELGGEVLRLYTCRRCYSTIALLEVAR